MNPRRNEVHVLRSKILNNLCTSMTFRKFSPQDGVRGCEDGNRVGKMLTEKVSHPHCCNLEHAIRAMCLARCPGRKLRLHNKRVLDVFPVLRQCVDAVAPDTGSIL